MCIRNGYWSFLKENEQYDFLILESIWVAPEKYVSLVDQGLASPQKTDSEMDKNNQKVHNSTGPRNPVCSKSDCRFRGRSSILAQSHTFVEIDYEIISAAILLLPLIQGGLLSVTNESMCTKYWLTP